MNQTTRIKDLFRKHIKNTITEQEQDELKHLLNDDLNRKEVERIMDEEFKLSRTESEGLTQQERSPMIENILASTTSTPKTKRFKLMLATATIVLVAVTGIWMYNQNPSNQITSLQQGNTLTFSGRDYLRLPDGTTVYLNEDTKLSYSSTENGREVILSGEAYFDVAHDASRPFTVRTGNVSTRVLGTAFNVKAYPSQKEMSVAVTRGKVQVGDEKRTFAVLEPNEQLTVNKAENNFVKANVNIKIALAWKENFLVLDEIDLEEAARLIGEKYKVKIIFDRPQLKKCGIYAKFPNNESLVDVLGVVSTAASVKYTIAEDGVVVISGKGCD